MELIDNFSEKVWQKGEAEQTKDFTPYTVIRGKPLGNGQFQYYVKEIRDDGEESEMVAVTIDGSAGPKKDPLKNVRNLALKVADGRVLGVDIDGDSVVRKDA